MKRLVLFLLIFVAAVAGLICMTKPAGALKNDGAVVQVQNTAPFSSFDKCIVAVGKEVMDTVEPVSLPHITMEMLEETPIEGSCFSDDIPLTHEEQEWLRAACEEFGVPYALTLGLIEKETKFRNIIGDNGASSGYMQIQKKWHWGRMERLGVTDLLEPNGNFRVGCDLLSELYEKYNDWSFALTAYNMGHYPGYVTNYAKDVMENYSRWQTLIDSYI